MSSTVKSERWVKWWRTQPWQSGDGFNQLRHRIYIEILYCKRTYENVFGLAKKVPNNPPPEESYDQIRYVVTVHLAVRWRVSCAIREAEKMTRKGFSRGKRKSSVVILNVSYSKEAIPFAEIMMDIVHLKLKLEARLWISKWFFTMSQRLCLDERVTEAAYCCRAMPARINDVCLISTFFTDIGKGLT